MYDTNMIDSNKSPNNFTKKKKNKTLYFPQGRAIGKIKSFPTYCFLKTEPTRTYSAPNKIGEKNYKQP